MKNLKMRFCVFSLGSVILVSCATQPRQNDYYISPVDFTEVNVNDGFWAPKILRNTKVTIPIAIQQCETTGRIDNFKAAGGLIAPGHRSAFQFDDSDVYKLLEGIAYSLMVSPNKVLEAKADSIIHYIALAQEKDGYLYTPHTNRAWEKNVRHSAEEKWVGTHMHTHELYCLGHFYEAAVAYYKATGKKEIMDVAVKSADLVCRVFGWGEGQMVSYPGHQEIEIGLCKLYRATGNRRYLDQAKFFLDARARRNSKEGMYKETQSHKPVLEQEEAVGHAVRALYMYSGMVDVAALTGDSSYIEAVHRMWDDIYKTKVYITGGVGPGNGNGEGFGPKYKLNNLGAYNETCAAVAGVLFNHRMFLMEGCSKYIDEMERTLYNNVLSGVSDSGDHFFYPNRLETEMGENRSPWFGCACCPTNLCRFLSSFAGYIYARKDRDFYVNLYVASNTNFRIGRKEITVTQSGDMPWKGNMSVKVDMKGTQDFTLKLRVPGWACNQASAENHLYRYKHPGRNVVKVAVNGEDVDCTADHFGYISLNRRWKGGDEVAVSLPVELREVLANEKVETDRGKVALQKGPLVYCSEGVDYEKNFNVKNLSVPDIRSLKTEFHPEIFGGVDVIKGKAGGNAFCSVPYFTWANRGRTPMVVWYPVNKK